MSSPTRLAAAQMVGMPGSLAVTRTLVTLRSASTINLNDVITEWEMRTMVAKSNQCPAIYRIIAKQCRML